jgi:hypothetical protein
VAAWVQQGYSPTRPIKLLIQLYLELHLHSSPTSPLAVSPNSDINLLPFKFLVNLLVAIVDINGCNRRLESNSTHLSRTTRQQISMTKSTFPVMPTAYQEPN